MYIEALKLIERCIKEKELYYPNLRWKQGEVKALENRPVEWEGQVCPVWIVENPQQGLVDAALGIESLWHGDQILDMSRVDIEDIEDDLLEAVTSSDLNFAISPNALIHLKPELRAIFDESPCFRVACPSSLHETIDTKLHDKHLSHISQFCHNQELRVIIDFGNVGQRFISSSSELALIVEMYLNAGVKNLIISGGSFPKTLEGILGVEHISRFERKLFDSLNELIEGRLFYSDYGTLSPDWNQSEIMRSKHINIRYTHDDYWVVLRQQGKDKAAIYELTQLLVLQPEFRDPQFSWADKIWSLKAEEPPKAGPGNSTNHVSEFIHHHIAQVLAHG